VGEVARRKGAAERETRRENYACLVIDIYNLDYASLRGAYRARIASATLSPSTAALVIPPA